MKKMIWVVAGLLCLAMSPCNAEVVTFDDLALDPESYYNGSDGAGLFVSAGVEFNNFYDDTYGPYWEGFAYSNTTDTTTPGFTNQYSVIAGLGAGASSIYGVGYVGFYGVVPTITFAEEVHLDRVSITNTTYAYLAMLDGAPPAKKFGGDNGGDPDWYLLTITGKNANDEVTDVIDFYLADFRFGDNAQDYIVDSWAEVDLSGLGAVKSVEFSVSSSDVGDFGINTPTYYAIDDIAIDRCPEDDDKIDAGLCGCGVADDDLDADGTPDCLDACPEDIDKVEPGECGCGIEDLDINGDGNYECYEGDNDADNFPCFIQTLEQ